MIKWLLFLIMKIKQVCMVWYGMVWFGMVWYGMVWYGMVWYGMVWFGMVSVIDYSICIKYNKTVTSSNHENK